MALHALKLDAPEADPGALEAVRATLNRYFGMSEKDLLGRLRIDDVQGHVCLVANGWPMRHSKSAAS